MVLSRNVSPLFMEYTWFNFFPPLAGAAEGHHLPDWICSFLPTVFSRGERPVHVRAKALFTILCIAENSRNMWIFRMVCLFCWVLRWSLTEINGLFTTWTAKESWTPEKSSHSTPRSVRVSARAFNPSTIRWTKAGTSSCSGTRTRTHFVIIWAFWEIFSELSGALSKACRALRRWTAPSWGCMWNWKRPKICSSSLHFPMDVTWSTASLF